MAPTSQERINSRNGYREHAWEPRADGVELKVPELRKGDYLPEFLEPRKTAEMTLTAVIQETYISGTSTRWMHDLVKALGMSGGFNSEVSRLWGALDEQIGAFLNPTPTARWPTPARRSGAWSPQP